MNKFLKSLICLSTVFFASTGCWNSSTHYTWDSDPNNIDGDVEVVLANGFANLFTAYDFKEDGYGNMSTYKWNLMRNSISLLITESGAENCAFNKAQYFVTDPKGEKPTGNGEEIVLFLNVCTSYKYKEVYKIYEKMQAYDDDDKNKDYYYAVFDSTIIITDSTKIVGALDEYKFLS